MTKYFKEYNKSLPSRFILFQNIIQLRKYLLNVVNTVNENSVFKAVQTVKEQRLNKQTTEAPIIITNEFASLLE